MIHTYIYGWYVYIDIDIWYHKTSLYIYIYIKPTKHIYPSHGWFSPIFAAKLPEAPQLIRIPGFTTLWRAWLAARMRTMSLRDGQSCADGAPGWSHKIWDLIHEKYPKNGFYQRKISKK